MLRSECLKLKQSLRLYLVGIFSLLELLMIPLYLRCVPSGISIEDLALVTLLIYPLIAATLSLLTFQQESLANYFQLILENQHSLRLWLAKLVVVDGLLGGASFLTWLLIGFLQNMLRTGIKLGLVISLTALFLNHFHFLLTFILAKGGNILIAILEMMVLLFASNSVLLGAYWCPVVLPVNFLLTDKVLNLVVTLIWICLCTVVLSVISFNLTRRSEF